jgi:S-DNA-T family DNA segregation ATPase FtsK/SpoIIIE
MNVESIQRFNHILQSFNIKASCIDYQAVDHYSFYDLKLNPYAKVKDIQKYGNEISLALQAPCKPSIKVFHEKGIVRVEFIAPRVEPLRLFDYFTNDGIPEMELPCLLGQTVEGKRMWMDLAKNPHLLIAGTTGSGKSTLMHNIIANLLNYNNVHMFLVDPKSIEFHKYDGHLKSSQVFYSYDDTLDMLNACLEEMESRYALLRGGKPISHFQHIVIIIDEFADLSLQDRDEQFYIALCRLAQKCRAARMHIILGTQRPSVNIINGAIKANFPARIACRVATHVDSKVILDASGAENLLGKGDALVRDNLRFMERFQVAHTTAAEVCQYYGV